MFLNINRHVSGWFNMVMLLNSNFWIYKYLNTVVVTLLTGCIIEARFWTTWEYLNLKPLMFKSWLDPDLFHTSFTSKSVYNEYFLKEIVMDKASCYIIATIYVMMSNMFKTIRVIFFVITLVPYYCR